MTDPLHFRLLRDDEPDPRFRCVFDNATDLIWIISNEGTLSDANPAFELLTGWSREEWLGQPVAPLFHPADLAAATHTVQQALQGRAMPRSDLRIRTKEGGHLIGHFIIAPFAEGDSIAGAIAMARDVTELRRLQSTDRETARTDALTGLANRRGCEEAIAREIARATRENAQVGIVLFDIDHFKKVNDTYGHEGGDAILTAVAGALRQIARATDVPGRWGGEELLAILPGVGVDGARRFAERVRVAVAALEGLPCRVTVSAGTAEWSRGQDVKTVLARADKMLYDAKGAGRNRVH